MIRSDVEPPGTIRADGFGVAHWLWLDGPPATVDDGGDDPDGSLRLEPPRRWLLGAAHPLPPRAAATGSGSRATIPTSPACTPPTPSTSWSCVDGRIVLGLDDGEHELGPGDVVDPARQPAPVAGGGRRPVHVRRVHAASRSRRRPLPPSRSRRRRAPTGDGAAPARGRHRRRRHARTRSPTAPRRARLDRGRRRHRAGRAVADRRRRWRTRAGRRPRGRLGARTTRRRAICFRTVEHPAGLRPRRGGVAHHRHHRRRHRGVRAGSSCRCPDQPPVVLGPGEAVVQRGTHHRWRPVGDEPVESGSR